MENQIQTLRDIQADLEKQLDQIRTEAGDLKSSLENTQREAGEAEAERAAEISCLQAQVSVVAY